jgi:hypothetical protein
MSEKRLNLTHNNREQITAITDTITTVPTELLQNTKDYLFATLENGNPLNRLIKDPENQNIIGFLAVEDRTDDQRNKIAYLGATALLPRQQRNMKINLDEEVQKLIKRAKTF